MTDLEKDKILLLAHSIGKMARELQSIKRLLNEIADVSQTERIKTLDYCDICNHKGCDNCIANNLDDYCVPSGYEPTTQTETQNSNLTFEKRTMRDCYNCKKYEAEGECIECHYEPKDEPQTVVIIGTPSNEFKLKNGQTGNEPMVTIAKTEQTERSE